ARYFASKSYQVLCGSTTIMPGTEASGGAPSTPSSTAHSTSAPVIAASTSTFLSYRRASSIAASSPSAESTRDVPIDDPPRAGLTNTGQPSRSATSSNTRLRSSDDGAAPQSLSRTTTYGPMGSPRAANRSFMYSLSMPAAEASTPAPAYRIPAISSSPWIVPSSP